MRDVALEVPLGAFTLGRRAECHGPHHARVGLLADPLDRSALAGGIAAFEDHDDFQTLVDDPVLETHELDLEALELLPVASLVELLALDLVLDESRTIPPRLDGRHCDEATESANRTRVVSTVCAEQFR